MIHLVRLFSLRHFSREKWKSGLTIVGIALGVAVFISIRISINSALGAFRSTVDHVAGKTHLVQCACKTETVGFVRRE